MSLKERVKRLLKRLKVGLFMVSILALLLGPTGLAEAKTTSKASSTHKVSTHTSAKHNSSKNHKSTKHYPSKKPPVMKHAKKTSHTIVK